MIKLLQTPIEKIEYDHLTGHGCALHFVFSTAALVHGFLLFFGAIQDRVPPLVPPPRFLLLNRI